MATIYRKPGLIFLLLVICCECVPSSVIDQSIIGENVGLYTISEKEQSCKENYGVLPCSDGIGANLFLLLVYSYIFVKAAQLILNGSEQLLCVADRGIVGGLCLPILCTIPDAALILVSGVKGSRKAAQSEVMIGMGVLAGSTVLLLTLLWGVALVVGRCDLLDINGSKVTKGGELTKGFSLTETGLTTNKQTSYVAWILVLSAIPCLIVQTPQMFNNPSVSKAAIIIGCVVSLLGFLAYCVYQVVTPWIQKSMVDWHRHRYRKLHALHRAHVYSRQHRWGELLLNDGKTLDHDVLRSLFRYFDKNGDGQLSEKELRGFVTSLGLKHESEIPKEKEEKVWMKEFSFSQNGRVSLEEFEEGIAKWINSTNVGDELVKRRSFRKDRSTSGHWEEIAMEAQASLQTLLEDDVEEEKEEKEEEEEEEEEVEEREPSKLEIALSAAFRLVCGVTLACAFAGPLVDTIQAFSNASHIPAFFISFVVTPLATNSSEAISSIAFAMRKKKSTISLTYSQIYGSVILNNTLCFGLFLAIVSVRGLVWDFNGEVVIMALVTLTMGSIGSMFRTFPTWVCLIAFSLYPVSLTIAATM